MFRRFLAILLALVFAAGSTASGSPTPGHLPPAAPGVRLDAGEIEGAKFVIARPAHWNGCVLLLAHGFREEKAPLVADLNPDHLAYRTLLDEGWVVAKTSFRRNGMIIRDAIADLENLRAHIAATCGAPRRVVLEGDSMGGAIVTLIAEQFADHYQGAVAVGAALQARESKRSLAFNLQPQIPLVFLTNQSELDGPRKYVTAPFDRPIQPLLLEVARAGHVNVNQRERLAALRTLFDLIDHQPVALPTVDGAPKFFDATQEPAPGPSQVRFLNEGGFAARVTEVTAIYGNLALNAQPSDFAAADIALGASFELVVRSQSFRVLYGRDFASVKRGQWVAFPNADGFFYVARNNADAAATAGLEAGAPVIIHRLSDTSADSP
ncbi:MAG TPA: SAM hydroxide adenosyltransferase [Opitutaceae bacterium]|nr:SAM hydroxide adenosyltransferase [Opitutaceae bacterium]